MRKTLNWLLVGLMAVAIPAMAQTPSVKIFKGGVEVTNPDTSVIINLAADPVVVPPVVPPVDPPVTPPGELAVGSNGGIMWGVNGHPIQGGTPYTATGMSIPTQLALVNSLGLKSYRMDLYDASTANQSVLRSVINAAKPFGIKVLPILMGEFDINSYANETAGYNAGRAMGTTYGTNFKGEVGVWELFNEVEGHIGAVSGQGSLISNYNAANVAKLRGLMRGLIDELKGADPACKVATGSNGGAAAWGLRDGLWASGVRWDITSEHFYSNAGRDDITALPLLPGLTNSLARNRDMYPGTSQWITEFNYYGAANTNSDTQAAAYLTKTMAQYDAFAKTYRLEGVHIYELLKQTAPDGGRLFGIMSGTGAANPPSNAVKAYLAQHPSVVYR